MKKNITSGLESTLFAYMNFYAMFNRNINIARNFKGLLHCFSTCIEITGITSTYLT